MSFELKKRLIFLFLDSLFETVKLYKIKIKKTGEYEIRGKTPFFDVFHANKKTIFFAAREYYLIQDMFSLTIEETDEFIKLYLAKKVDSKLIYLKVSRLY